MAGAHDRDGVIADIASLTCRPSSQLPADPHAAASATSTWICPSVAGCPSTLYVLDEPTTDLHPADVELLDRRLHRLVDAGNTVVVAEHDMDVVAGADRVIDLGPGAGDGGGRVVAADTPQEVAEVAESRTAPYLAARLRPPVRVPA
jgi:ABC-type cobalamin transport system ATPase subunit